VAPLELVLIAAAEVLEVVRQEPIQR